MTEDRNRPRAPHLLGVRLVDDLVCHVLGLVLHALVLDWRLVDHRVSTLYSCVDACGRSFDR